MKQDKVDPEHPAIHGRFIDEELGLLSGEAADQRTKQTVTTALKEPSSKDPIDYTELSEGPTYYNQPVVQKPVWVWSVPTYFYVGGAAGASLVLAAAAQLFDGAGLRDLIRRGRWTGAIGVGLGAGLLIYDLGKPSRFLHMLRLFRPTSPLSVGSWLLTLTGPVAGLSALLTDAPAPLRRLGDAASFAAGLLGMPVAGYTAVVLTDSAIPAWQEVRRALPVAFIASAMTAATSYFEFTGLSDREQKIIKRFSVPAKAAEVASIFAVERFGSRIDTVGREYRKGRGGFLWQASKALVGASLLLSLLPGKSKKKRMTAAALSAAGALCVKFGIMEIGKASANEPQATFHQQRLGYGAHEVIRRSAVVGPDDQRAAPGPKRLKLARPAPPPIVLRSGA